MRSGRETRKITRNSDPKMSMLEREGNPITNSESIKERYIEYYKELVRLRPLETEAIDTINQAHQKFQINKQIKAYDTEEINVSFTEKEL